MIAGAEGWEDIEDFGRCHLDWLKQHGDFSLGIPVHDTIARLVSRVDPGPVSTGIHCLDATNRNTDTRSGHRG